MSQTASRFAGQVDQAWLDRLVEPVLEPELPIIDPHHHLWVREGNVYLLTELLADLSSGHNVIATVFEECHSMYRATGSEDEKSLGETEFVTGTAAMGASGAFGPSRVCARMIGRVDLMLGDRARELLERHLIASGGRFAGIRQSTAWDASDRIHKVVPRPGMLGDTTFRAGFAGLAALGLVFDTWVYHPQLPEVGELADAFPHTQIVLNHVGSPILGGHLRWRPSAGVRGLAGGHGSAGETPQRDRQAGRLADPPAGGRHRFARHAAHLRGGRRRLASMVGNQHRTVRR
jgi:L-fuconolactonase